MGSYGWAYEFSLRPGFESTFDDETGPVPASSLCVKVFRDVSMRPAGEAATSEEGKRYLVLGSPMVDQMIHREAEVVEKVRHANLVHVRKTYRRYHNKKIKPDHIYIEKKGSGISLLQEFRRAGVRVKAVKLDHG